MRPLLPAKTNLCTLAVPVGADVGIAQRRVSCSLCLGCIRLRNRVLASQLPQPSLLAGDTPLNCRRFPHKGLCLLVIAVEAPSHLLVPEGFGALLCGLGDPLTLLGAGRSR